MLFDAMSNVCGCFDVDKLSVVCDAIACVMVRKGIGVYLAEIWFYLMAVLCCILLYVIDEVYIFIVVNFYKWSKVCCDALIVLCFIHMMFRSVIES